MLPLSDFTITFNQSKDYLKLALLIHLIAIIVLFQSSLPSLIIFAILVGLLVPITSILRNPIPIPNYHKLTFHMGYWLLHGINEQQIKYERAYISFDAGFFKLLTMTGGNKRKNSVIFNDQLSTYQYRIMLIIDRQGASKTDEGKKS